jgi:hypothetical protein
MYDLFYFTFFLNHKKTIVKEVMKNMNMASENKLATFFERYENYEKKADDATINPKHFWDILSPYEGLVRSEMHIRIDQDEITFDSEGRSRREFEVSEVHFDLGELQKTIGISRRYRLIKFIIELSDDRNLQLGKTHTNLIYIDTKTKDVVRFEPMFNPYTEPINTILTDYFTSVLPQYKYSMLKEHPQSSPEMDEAFVLKKAMLLVNGIDVSMVDSISEREKILKFAHAIEIEQKDDAGKEYGLFDPSSWKRSTQTGVAGGAIGGGLGLLLGGGFKGALLGAGIGALGGYLLGKKRNASTPQYSPQQQYQQQYSQQMYQPQYQPRQIYQNQQAYY